MIVLCFILSTPPSNVLDAHIERLVGLMRVVAPLDPSGDYTTLEVTPVVQNGQHRLLIKESHLDLRGKVKMFESRNLGFLEIQSVFLFEDRSSQNERRFSLVITYKPGAGVADPYSFEGEASQAFSQIKAMTLGPYTSETVQLLKRQIAKIQTLLQSKSE